jgi:SAM-dependent methyltransferase
MSASAALLFQPFAVSPGGAWAPAREQNSTSAIANVQTGRIIRPSVVSFLLISALWIRVSARQRIYQSLERQREGFQAARAELFLRLMKPRSGARVLDLGGNRGHFGQRLLQRSDLDITVADVIDFSVECAQAGLQFVQIDEAERLPFHDREFDIVFCNSVIEHVTLPKSECSRTDLAEADWKRRASARQRQFAHEIRRVGQGYFVQTPNKHFPVDVHLWLPFTNWLSHKAALRLTAFTNRFWIKGGEPDWELLAASDLREMFPDANLHVERLFGLPKSLIAYRTPA